ncbi:DUF2127 domain-containing protein [Herbaspirillum sp. RTI4]|uniref:DUF2127 domain-containing protein n=1 Tax=Herbaspirillum sp. RTI4 TaxID=3048640 RepID=UPI002AB5C0C7|nr:DUF2127 domain-containing protein [Herbaspirillum sp. RTI4]MDY7579640.1 DUF2127 domain-containing protein [Herbaspirillum sp. RTI4]MEA9981855.1 DUF2127 domain-containing protein [Herbaspirillum sp. RTI4]
MSTPLFPDTPVAALPPAKRRTLRVIAVFELVKGMAALAAAIGLLSLLHHDLRHLAVELIGHFGLHPDAPYPSIFLHYADILSDQSRRTIILVATAYIGLRFFEAYGLWYSRVWAEWLGAVSGALYIPLEIRHLLLHTTWMNAAVLLGNIFVVLYLLLELRRRHQHHVAVTLRRATLPR